MAPFDATEALEQANTVTSNAASVLRGLIDAGEQGVHIALRNLGPIAEQLDALFSDHSDPVPAAPTGGVPTDAVIAEGGSDQDAAQSVGGAG
jgi:hypothetical protein